MKYRWLKWTKIKLKGLNRFWSNIKGTICIFGKKKEKNRNVEVFKFYWPNQGLDEKNTYTHQLLKISLICVWCIVHHFGSRATTISAAKYSTDTQNPSFLFSFSWLLANSNLSCSMIVFPPPPFFRLYNTHSDRKLLDLKWHRSKSI